MKSLLFYIIVFLIVAFATSCKTNISDIHTSFRKGDYVTTLSEIENLHGSTITEREFDYIQYILCQIINESDNENIVELAEIELENLDCHILVK
jgi:hypothetical protein